MNRSSPLLAVSRLTVSYPMGRGPACRAVSGVSFRLEKGETLGLVGESGCGKTSLARAIIQLPPPTAGEVRFHGEDLTRAAKDRLRRLRPRFQMIFQDSASALNPRRPVGKTIAMPLSVTGRICRDRQSAAARKMLAAVGLDPQTAGWRPYRFSGGQCQRIQIARALMARPELLICDEPVSALDVSIQAQILNLLEQCRRRYGLTLLFISHDMAVIKNVSDRVMVMYLGKICEIAPTEAIFRRPAHPYTATLIAAIPAMGRKRHRLKEAAAHIEIPSPLHPPPGCRFHPRCPFRRPQCTRAEPALTTVDEGRQVACHHPLDLLAETDRRRLSR